MAKSHIDTVKLSMPEVDKLTWTLLQAVFLLAYAAAFVTKGFSPALRAEASDKINSSINDEFARLLAQCALLPEGANDEASQLIVMHAESYLIADYD